VAATTNRMQRSASAAPAGSCVSSAVEPTPVLRGRPLLALLARAGAAASSRALAGDARGVPAREFVDVSLARGVCGGVAGPAASEVRGRGGGVNRELCLYLRWKYYIYICRYYAPRRASSRTARGAGGASKSIPCAKACRAARRSRRKVAPSPAPWKDE